MTVSNAKASPGSLSPCYSGELPSQVQPNLQALQNAPITLFNDGADIATYDGIYTGPTPAPVR